MSTETFPLHFEGCEHVLNIPLLHNPDPSRCYLCRPELRDRPVTRQRATGCLSVPLESKIFAVPFSTHLCI